jgi:hypothetical protein
MVLIILWASSVALLGFVKDNVTNVSCINRATVTQQSTIRVRSFFIFLAPYTCFLVCL